MNFEEYCKKNQYSLNQTRSQAFTMGAASRQAEIDELQKRIDGALNCTEKCTWNMALDELKKILKGKENEKTNK